VNYEPSEEAVLLRESVRGVLGRHWPAEKAIEAGSDPESVLAIYRILADQGFCALGRGAEDGGIAEAIIVAEELGRAHCPAPVLDAYLVTTLETAAATPPSLRAMFAESRSGQACVAIASAAPDFDLRPGTASVTGGRVSAQLDLVEQGALLDYVGVPIAPAEIAFLRCDPSVVSLQPGSALSMPGFPRLTLEAAPADVLVLPAGLLDELSLLSRLLHTARALGAARRAFELAADYAKARVQFGRPIGQFQAIQHRLANCHITLEGVSLLVRHAANQSDADAPDWQYFAAAAHAFAAVHLPEVSLETHHAFGAIGYAEDHEAPRHFKRVHLDVLMAGGLSRSRRELADHLLGPGTAGLPRFDLGPAGNAFRDEVHDWLERNWSGARKQAHDALSFKEREFDRQFTQALGETGWIGASWPPQFGGQGRSPIEQVAFMEEMERHEAPRFGAPVQAAMLMSFGTRQQQDRYLPEILAGRAMFGMGYSEPEAGSDLASLRTSAVRDGSGWIINGQKVWTTTYWGDYMLLAVRTDPQAQPKHAGISLFIVPMDTPGITVKVDTTMYSGSFANVFYDNVRVPWDAMIGEANHGWEVLTSALATERGTVGGGIVLKVACLFEQLCDLLREAEPGAPASAASPLTADMIAMQAAEIEAGRQMMLACAYAAQSGRTPLDLAAVSKVFSGELMEKFLEAALRIVGPAGAISQDGPGAILGGRLEQALRHSLMWVISIGTNDIQRTLIARKALGMPR